LLGRADSEYQEKLLDGQVFLFSRNGIFQARLYKGKRSYIFKSLKTRDVNRARQLATKAFYELEFRKEQNLPLQDKPFGEVIDEYVRLREAQYNRGTYGHKNKTNQEQTSIHMLRQIKRVSKFWREFGGQKAVASIDNAWLRQYVEWRVAYYTKMPAEKRPRNHKLIPADKTLEWETTFVLTLLRFATQQGYRGIKPMPEYRFKAGRFTVRPAFTLDEYRKLYTEMRRWLKEASNPKYRYTREMLRDYVLLLSNSGIRVGEANNLLESDIEPFTDKLGRQNYYLRVRGKTGERLVVMRAGGIRCIQRTLERNRQWRTTWQQAAAEGAKRHNRLSAEHKKWLFPMVDGNKIISLGDQFKVILKRTGIEKSDNGQDYSLYCLRHFYAVQTINRGKVTTFHVARNMGTSIEIIENYYAKHSTAMDVATELGG
jgi:site-specific recombinase XerD